MSINVGTPADLEPTAESVTEARRQETLLKTAVLQSAIFNSANFSSIATDAKGVIQIFNVGAERMLGYAATDVMNKITPADISDPQELIARAKALSVELATPITPGFEALVFKASRGIEDIYELTYIRKDGSRFPAVVSVTALRDAQEAIIGYLLIGTDNTARKQVEAEQKLLDQKLRDQQFYTRSLIESNIDALMTTDPSGIITDVNKQMEALTGCTRDEMIGAPFKNYFTDPERAEASIKLVLSQKNVTDYELTASAKDGKNTVVSYNATTFYDRDRRLQGVFAAARDITERKRLDQRLHDQQFYTRSLIESNIDALMTTDPSGIITDVNKQMEELTACTRDELIGAPFKNYFTDAERAEAAIKRVLSEKKVTNYELTARARDGKETVVSYNATTFYDRDRKLQGVFAAARDITERKRLDQVLQDKNAEMERVNLVKDRFLAGMSHELRTPLNAIIGFTGTLIMKLAGPLTVDQDKQLHTIQNSGRHLLSLINDLLDLAKIESGKVEINLEATVCQDVIQEVAGILRPSARNKGLELRLILPEQNVVFRTDRRAFSQILINLVNNAIKFTKTGEVSITLNVRNTNGVAWTDIHVKDTGIGISPEQQTKLFQAFAQLESSSTRQHEGTGLGLYLCQKLSDLIGGKISLQSEPHKGSTFTLSIENK